LVAPLGRVEFRPAGSKAIGRGRKPPQRGSKSQETRRVERSRPMHSRPKGPGRSGAGVSFAPLGLLAFLLLFRGLAPPATCYRPFGTIRAGAPGRVFLSPRWGWLHSHSLFGLAPPATCCRPFRDYPPPNHTPIDNPAYRQAGCDGQAINPDDRLNGRRGPRTARAEKRLKVQIFFTRKS